MSQESCVLDPVEFIPERAELALDQLGLEIRAEGVDWGESQITPQMARQSEGEESFDGHRNGVQIRIPIRVKAEGSVSLAQAAHKLQQKVGTIQDGGGWIRRDFDDGGGFAGSTGYKLLRHTMALSGLDGWLFAHRQDAPDVVITATRAPIGYPTEEREEGPFTSTAGARHLEFTEPASKGSAQGLWRAQINNEGAEDWRGLILSRECRDAPDDLGDPTAQMHYLAKNLTPKGGAEKATVSGVELVRHTALTAGWLTILSSEIAGTGHMTHRGPRPMWMRVYDPGEVAEDVQLQLAWRALGSSRWDELMPIVPVPVVDGWIPVFLGTPRPERAVLGDERWEWRLMARALSGTGQIRVRDVYPLSAEQYCVLREPYASPAADTQSQKSAGSIESVADAQRPGWVNNNLKASDDSRTTCNLGSFYPEYESELLKVTNFAFGLPEGATVVGIVAEVERSRGTAPFAQDSEVRILKGGALGSANYAVSGNWPSADAYQAYGSANDLWGESWTPADINSSGFGLAIRVSGSAGNPGSIQIDHVRVTVYYAEEEPEDKVCFAGRSVELASDAVVRQHSSEDVWGRVVPDGRYPVTPAGGLESRPVRTIIIPSAGDLISLPDSATPSVEAYTSARDGFHFAREAA